MEQAHAGEGHDHVFSVALFDDQVVPDGAAGFGDIPDAGGEGTLDGVGDLGGDQLCGQLVADIGQSHPVAEGAQTVGATGTDIGAGMRDQG